MVGSTHWLINSPKCSKSGRIRNVLWVYLLRLEENLIDELCPETPPKWEELKSRGILHETPPKWEELKSRGILHETPLEVASEGGVKGTCKRWCDQTKLRSITFHYRRYYSDENKFSGSHVSGEKSLVSYSLCYFQTLVQLWTSRWIDQFIVHRFYI